MVGAAVPCGPLHQPDRETVYLKSCSPLFVSGTCIAFRRSISEALCCSSEFIPPPSLFLTQRYAEPRREYPQILLPPFYIFYIFYTVNIDTPLSASPREIFYPLPILYTVNCPTTPCPFCLQAGRGRGPQSGSRRTRQVTVCGSLIVYFSSGPGPQLPPPKPVCSTSRLT